jgi:mRNA interferase MazF
MKDFINWNKTKIKLDGLTTYRHPKEKEIWWCGVGVNVGSEIYGKGERFSRPVLVINSEGTQTFIGIPLTSGVNPKKYSCLIKTEDDVLHTALVYQIRSFDKRRLQEKMYTLSDNEYSLIKTYFQKLYKI